MTTNNHKLIEAIQERDILTLRELAGEYSDEASINQSQRNINLAIISYSLNKIYSKIHLREKTRDLEAEVILKLTEDKLEEVRDAIFAFDEENGLFYGGLGHKARVKIGSRLYSQGLSITQSANLVDININEIQDYVGETKDHDTHHGRQHGSPLEERLRHAREIL